MRLNPGHQRLEACRQRTTEKKIVGSSALADESLDRQRVVQSVSTAFVVTVVITGSLAILSGLHDVIRHPVPIQALILLGLTLLSGSATLRIPSIPVSFSISDTFTMTAALLFGPSVGTLIVAADALAISGRLARRKLSPRRAIFNATAPPLAMWLAAHLFFALAHVGPLRVTPIGVWQLLPPFALFVSTYFLCNTGLIALAVSFETQQSVTRIWREHFLGLWVSFLGGGLVAALLVLLVYHRESDLQALLILVPLPLILHAMFRDSMRHAEERIEHLDKVNHLYQSTIEALAMAIDAKDQVTHGHIRRVQRFSARLAAALKVTDERELKALQAASLLHDTGKLAIPEHILNKPDKLTTGEFERMKTHAAIGADILSSIEFPFPVVPIVRHHHENWDGSGYPDGMTGAAIPIGARILSVVDCYDALTSDRPYRRALSPEDAFAIIQGRAGTMYDPAVVAAFREVCGASDSAVIAARPQSPVATTVPSAAFSADAGTPMSEDIQLALDLGAVLGASPQSRTSWAAVADALAALSDVDAVVVFAIEQTEQRLTPVATAGLDAKSLARLSIPIGERLSGWVAATEQAMINADPALDLFDVTSESFCTAVSALCHAADGSRAVITLYSSHPAIFRPFHARLLVEVARRAPLSTRRWEPGAVAGTRPDRRLILK